VIAPVNVGTFVAEQIPDSQLVLLDATGHCPNLSAPEPTASAIAEFVRTQPGRVLERHDA
jgi:sigma-B regulation protein RsbQ